MKTERLKKNLIIIFVISVFLLLALLMFNDRKPNIMVLAQEKYSNITSPERSDNLVVIQGSNTSATSAKISEFTDVQLIKNNNYFLINPRHHINDGSDNKGGTCTTVAVQMLLGYHNYYSDRRLIPKTGNGRIFLEADYGKITQHPVFPRNRVYGQGCKSIGLADGVYEEIFDKTWISDWKGIGQAFPLVIDGTDKFLKEFLPPEIESEITMFWSIISYSSAKFDLDADRPIVLGTQPFRNTNDSFHVMPAYGYGKLDGKDGYFIHDGHGDDITMGWIPKEWVMFQMRMSVDHTHDFVDTGNIIYDTHREIECSTCGYSEPVELYNVTDGVITGVNYPLFGEITVPYSINGVTITGIGDGAFENQAGITSIELPYSLEEIGDNAFKGCSALESIEIETNVTSIGYGAFAGCDKLDISVNYANSVFTASGNVLYNKGKTEIIAAGKAKANFIVPASVDKIAPYAFYGNGNIESLRFDRAPNIGAYAFADCEKLYTVYFETYDVPAVDDFAFSGNDFMLYVPYNSLSGYRTVFSAYTNYIQARQIIVSFVRFGEAFENREVFHGSAIGELPDGNVVGYDFGGWFDNDAYSGAAYASGGLWKSGGDRITLYAKLTPKQYAVTLDAVDGTLTGDGGFTVTYGSSFSVSAMAEKTGYTFDGWYDADGKKYMTAAGESVVLWDKPENSTLYARFLVKNYEIRIIDGNKVVWLGASGISDDSCSIEYGTVLDTINLIYTFKNSSHGYKEGRIFERFEYDGSALNWSSVPDLGENGAIIVITPVWTLEEHTIYFNTLFDVTVSPVTAKYDENILLPSLSRTGYRFDGWYTSSSGGTKILWTKMPDLTPNAQNNGSRELFARFNPITYSVMYYPNGGYGTMKMSYHTYDKESKLNVNTYTKTNNDLLGWAYSPSGSVVFTDGQAVKNLTSEQGKIISLYAVWRGCLYNINYHNLTFDGQTAKLLFDGTVLKTATLQYEYGIGLDINRVSAFFQSASPYSPQFRFLGWYTSGSFTTKASSISANVTGAVNLYAKWRYDFSCTGRNGTIYVTDKGPFKHDYDQIYVGLNLRNLYSDLKDLGMKYLALNYKLNMWEIQDGYQEIYLYSGSSESSELLWAMTEIEHGGSKKDTTPSVFECNIFIPLDSIKDADFLYFRYSAHGFGNDDWASDILHIEISFVAEKGDIASPAFYWDYKSPF